MVSDVKIATRAAVAEAVVAVGLESIIMFCVGCFSVAAGAGIVLFRERVAAWNARNIEKKSGTFLPRFSAESTAARMIPVGIGAVLVGIGLLARAVWG